jgi:hypothetical protein
MDYKRNKLYFYPIPARDIEEGVKKAGCGPGILIGIGAILMFSAMGAEAIEPALIGLLQLIGGIAWLVSVSNSNSKIREANEKFNNERPKVSGEEIDKAAQSYVTANLKKMALKKLGFEDEEGHLSAAKPIYFDGYVFDKEFRLGNEEGRWRKGSDGRYRSSVYNAVQFFFSADQVFFYKMQFSLLEDVKQESAREMHYQDIVDVFTETESRTISIKSTSKDPNQPKQKDDVFQIENFTLTSTGATKMNATIWDIEGAERSIQGMKSLIRSKKTDRVKVQTD